MTLKYDIYKYLKKYIIAFSIISGFGLATKIMIFPFDGNSDYNNTEFKR